MTQVLTEDLRRAGHYIVSESNGYRSREQGFLASGSGVVAAGSVVGKVTATGQFKLYDPTANDGTETAVAINYEGKDATAEAQRVTFTIRDTEIHSAVLTWADGITEEQKTTAMQALSERGIVGR